MADLIYCPNYPNGPPSCGGIRYQTTYDKYGVANGAYSCNYCDRILSMSEHTVLLATQRKVETLEIENAELRAHNTELETKNTHLETLYGMLLLTLSNLGVTIANGIHALDAYENEH